MPKSHTDIVRAKLKAYSDRGVFRGFNETSGRGDKTTFKFIWLLDREFTLEFSPDKGTLMLKDILPHVPNRSHMDQDLRAFVLSRNAKNLPSHRRVNPKQAELTYTNRKENVSLTMTVKTNQYGPAVTKLLNTANAFFGHLHMAHLPYLWEHFDVPEE